MVILKEKNNDLYKFRELRSFAKLMYFSKMYRVNDNYKWASYLAVCSSWLAYRLAKLLSNIPLHSCVCCLVLSMLLYLYLFHLVSIHYKQHKHKYNTLKLKHHLNIFWQVSNPFYLSDQVSAFQLFICPSIRYYLRTHGLSIQEINICPPM